MSIAAEVLEPLLRPAPGRLGVDDPGAVLPLAEERPPGVILRLAQRSPRRSGVWAWPAAVGAPRDTGPARLDPWLTPLGLWRPGSSRAGNPALWLAAG
jgi:hypothetical protein